ncbi:MAG: hypothetical protein HOM34_06300 [Planctomycetes bacterium]|jgi:hypothetical protein|nr:hypothetical protein [Planctomycetota bacterium]MBT4029229.1 hypothetical protein [Planctomycetota bacterium]MBT4559310.1 hypothetical protein [Planctomycetota bacterium]MBT5120316.1 hypothetical protein [Planctomycetota bacterium]MBT7012711.1 hypothetical protein [Planctomycetota bacterium]
MFTLADFELYNDRFQSDPEWNGRRLEIRRRLQAVGDSAKAAFAAEGLGLDRRESLHNPHASNGKRVRRQRTMLFRDKKSRKGLQSFLGRELGKDLDSAVNNLHFQLGLDHQGAWWGLRIDKGAWYDLNVMLKRAEDAPGRKELMQAAHFAPGYSLEIDRKGARALEKMTDRDWRDLAGTLQPGQNIVEIMARMPAAAVDAAGEDFDEGIVADLLRLLPLYQLACWGLDSPSGVSL